MLTMELVMRMSLVLRRCPHRAIALFPWKKDPVSPSEPRRYACQLSVPGEPLYVQDQ